MDFDFKSYESVKESVERRRRELDRAEGALGQLMVRLKKEHSCVSLEDAENKLKLLRRKTVEKEKVFADLLSEFEDKWGDQLK